MLSRVFEIKISSREKEKISLELQKFYSLKRRIKRLDLEINWIILSTILS